MLLRDLDTETDICISFLGSFVQPGSPPISAGSMRCANLSNKDDVSVTIVDIWTNVMAHCSTETDA